MKAIESATKQNENFPQQPGATLKIQHGHHQTFRGKLIRRRNKFVNFCGTVEQHGFVIQSKSQYRKVILAMTTVIVYENVGQLQ